MTIATPESVRRSAEKNIHPISPESKKQQRIDPVGTMAGNLLFSLHQVSQIENNEIDGILKQDSSQVNLVQMTNRFKVFSLIRQVQNINAISLNNYDILYIIAEKIADAQLNLKHANTSEKNQAIKTLMQSYQYAANDIIRQEKKMKTLSFSKKNNKFTIIK